MKEDGCNQNDCCFNTMIQGLLLNKDTVKAREIIDEMRENGFSADAATTAMAIDLLSSDDLDQTFANYFTS